MRPARELILPSAGSSHWLPAGEPPGGLLYLAWGRRRYGEHPIPRRLHHGWSTMLVFSGSPVLLAGSRTRPLVPGSLVIAGPDVGYGWEDRPGGSCVLLVWVWKEAPVFLRASRKTSCWIRRVDKSALSGFQELHERTRGEIQHADRYSPSVLGALKQILEAACERTAGGVGNNAATRSAQQLHLAESWMLRHLDVRSPVAALADYLGLSAMGLQRLFVKAAGLSPGRAFLQIKMREAEALLKRRGSSVKEVALALGYRHAGDFTRAFARFHGHTPKESRPGGPPPARG